MPELPEVETLRRSLEATVRGRVIRAVRISGLKLRAAVSRELPTRLAGHSIERVRRHGKYLLLDLSGDLTLLSHLGMSGRWLFFARTPSKPMPHVHAQLEFRDRACLWFQDPRRFGLLRLAATSKLDRDRSLAILGPDPIETPPSAVSLAALARGTRVNVKNFLLDQRRMAGIGNIYASEILHRAGVDPRRRAGALGHGEWARIAEETLRVLEAAIARMGTTFSSYRTLWNQPGAYGDQLMVYDRAGEPCRRCATSIRRIVQGQRSTFFCPQCQRPSHHSPRGPSRRDSLARATRPHHTYPEKLPA